MCVFRRILGVLLILMGLMLLGTFIFPIEFIVLVLAVLIVFVGCVLLRG